MINNSGTYQDCTILYNMTAKTMPHTNLKRFGDRAFCAYAPSLWNELPDNIKAAKGVQNFKTVENIAISKGVYLTIHGQVVNMSTGH